MINSGYGDLIDCQKTTMIEKFSKFLLQNPDDEVDNALFARLIDITETNKNEVITQQVLKGIVKKFNNTTEK
jgi:hypothetical protein